VAFNAQISDAVVASTAEAAAQALDAATFATKVNEARATLGTAASVPEASSEDVQVSAPLITRSSTTSQAASSGADMGLILGLVVGLGLAGLIGVGLFIWWYRRGRPQVTKMHPEGKQADLRAGKLDLRQLEPVCPADPVDLRQVGFGDSESPLPRVAVNLREVGFSDNAEGGQLQPGVSPSASPPVSPSAMSIPVDPVSVEEVSTPIERWEGPGDSPRHDSAMPPMHSQFGATDSARREAALQFENKDDPDEDTKDDPDAQSPRRLASLPIHPEPVDKEALLESEIHLPVLTTDDFNDHQSSASPCCETALQTEEFANKDSPRRETALQTEEFANKDSPRREAALQTEEFANKDSPRREATLEVETDPTTRPHSSHIDGPAASEPDEEIFIAKDAAPMPAVPWAEQKDAAPMPAVPWAEQKAKPSSRPAPLQFDSLRVETIHTPLHSETADDAVEPEEEIVVPEVAAPTLPWQTGTHVISTADDDNDGEYADAVTKLDWC